MYNKQVVIIRNNKYEMNVIHNERWIEFRTCVISYEIFYPFDIKRVEVGIGKGYLVDASLNKFGYKNMNWFNVDKGHNTISFTIISPMTILLARVLLVTDRPLRKY